jgi:hypothetical protein
LSNTQSSQVQASSLVSQSSGIKQFISTPAIANLFENIDRLPVSEEIKSRIKENQIEVFNQNILDTTGEARGFTPPKTTKQDGGGFETDIHREFSSNSSIQNCKRSSDEKSRPSISTSGDSGCENSIDNCKKDSGETINGNEKIIIFRDDGTNEDKNPGYKIGVTTQSSSSCNPLMTSPQSDIDSNNDNNLTRYLPVILIIGVGTLGALASKFFTLSTHAHKLELSSLKPITLPQSAKGTPQDLHFSKRAINTKGAGSNIGITDVETAVAKKNYIGHVTLMK